MSDNPPVTNPPREASGAEPLGVVVVSTDPGRLAQYRMALRMAGVTAALTDDTDEAEQWMQDRLPASLVLDQGLPRMMVFRLYGLVRDNEWARGISVIFVGQEGSGGPGDDYLPADASPLAVAAQAQELAERTEKEAPTNGPATAAVVAEPEVTDAPSVPPVPPAPVERVAEVERPAPIEPPARPERESHPEREPAAAVPVAAASAAAAASASGAAATTSDESLPAAEDDEPERKSGSGRRLDVILFRVGLVLLILGGAMIFLRPDPSTSTAVPPTASPATATRVPAASPSPAANIDTPAGVPVRFLYRR